jgi:hypothetical protein
MYSRKKTNLIPDPGQRVRLLERRGRRRGRYRTISGPLTDPKGEAVIWVAKEREYREALRESRPAEGMPWPARQMEVFSEDTQAGAQESEETARRPWWRRILGG